MTSHSLHAVLLHDNWQFQDARDGVWYAAQVPGCVHTDLQRHELIPDPFWGQNERALQWIEECDWNYRLTFDLAPALLNRQHIELVADGLDTLATITLNGRELANTANMFVAHRFEVKNWLREGANTLEIRFASPMPFIRERQRFHDGMESNDAVKGCSNLRKEQCSFGWDWGPRFATSGIYQALKLEAWDSNRIDWVHLAQHHQNGAVALELKPHIAPLTSAGSTKTRWRATVSLGGDVVAQSETNNSESALGEAARLHLAVPDAQLWWPNGAGAQPLYQVEVELLDDEDRVLDVWRRRVGLRTVELDRHADEWGESFQFVVNGRAIFAKGANWIPAHSFVTQSPAYYDDLLSSSVAANMNMLRVWGGGIYELDEFYDLCDEKGLLLWHDFMFSCATYPHFDEFLGQVEPEATYQVRRLQHRACLALWCGNNEIEMMPLPRARFQNDQSAMRGYKDLFYRLLPETVARNDGATPYWPSSPHDPTAGPEGAPTADTMISGAGDIHYWGVWHSKNPVKDYEKTQYRFCSEFGMQSYPSPEVAQTFCPASELNIFSPVFENHQKNGGGNATIFHYVSQRYRFPQSYRALSYLSQLNQAYCMKIGVEHWRRSMPQCMGALFWQLNDCWPVASWSSLEFGGRWKALHFEARRFFAPALVSAHVPGDIHYDKHNFAHNSIGEVRLYTTYDGLEMRDAVLRWTLFHLQNGLIFYDSMSVQLLPNESQQHRVLDCSTWMQQHGAENLVLRLSLEANGEVLSQNTVFLTLPRLMSLPCAPIEIEVAQKADETVITARSSVFHHQVQLEMNDAPAARWSDNFFDLYPDRPHSVTLMHNSTFSVDELKAKLSAYSLVNTYSN